MWKCLSSPSIPRLIGLWLIFRTNMVAAANFESFNCSPEAKDGSSALQNAHGFPDHNPAVECDYPTAGSCFYTSDVSFMTQPTRSCTHVSVGIPRYPVRLAEVPRQPRARTT
jgi:hypothetical protein